MNSTIRNGLARCGGIVLLVAGTVPGLALAEPLPDKSKPALMFDVRVRASSNGVATGARQSAMRDAGMAAVPTARAIADAVATRSRTQPDLEVKLSPLTGGPASIHNKRGALTGSAPGQSGETIVRDYLQQNRDIFGLTATDMSDLVVLGDSAGGGSGLRMLRVEQQVNGRPVFQGETRFLMDRDGRLVKGVGLIIPNARVVAQSASAAQFMTPEAAVANLLAAEGKTIDPASFTVTTDSGGRIELIGSDGYTAGPITARQVLFPLAPGVLVPAWSLVVFTTGEQDWYAVIDAESGELLWRKGMREYVSTHDARFRVYVQADGVTPADSPAPQSPSTAVVGAGTQSAGIAPTIVSMHTAMDATASPNGWIADCPGGICTANETQTLGNNALVCMDRVGGAGAGGANQCDTAASSVLDGNGRPTGNPDANSRNRDFLGTTLRNFETNFLPSPQGGNPEAGQTPTGNGNNGTLAVDQFRRGAITNLFYLTNWYHDKLFALGFDEAAGNFQQTNFSGMGLGNDRVLADMQDSSSTDSASFSTPPDGTSGRMQMFRFIGPTVDREGSLDAETVLHELSHGLSSRLIGNGAGLNWDPGKGMAEGWSDFYALSLLNNTNADDPDGMYPFSAYLGFKLGGVTTFMDNYVYGRRRFPYSTDHSVNPLTWADVDDVTLNLSGGIAPTPLTAVANQGGMGGNNSGEVWALSLWGARARIIADPAGANGDVPTGNQTMLQLVTDALKMTPIDPSFTEARDALFQTDCVTNACANEASVWGSFADRGLGYGARTPFNVMYGYIASHMGVHESFSVPFLDVVNPMTDVTIDDSISNNNGAIDPGEAVRMTVKLTNPWRAAAKAATSATATLTTSTPGVTIYDDTSTYGAIAPQGSATGDTFTFTVASSMTAGAPIDFMVTTVSNLGTTSTSFRLRVGTANGADPVVTYTNGPALALAIPDLQARGVFHQITITDDFVIADLDFRIDSISHTFPGDLTAMLRSPDALGVDLMGLIGGMVAGGGDGDNITNMVIDDDLPLVAGNDMVQAPNAAAPYTQSWLPVFNGPWADLAGFGPADPVGNLSRYDGKSTQGTWSMLVSDQAGGDTGTLNSWSMLVTPVHYDIALFTPTVAVAATKTVSGTFSVGQTVTYTVTLTNNGTVSQADNAGYEFTDVLPASLTLVSAIASSGTAATAASTVTWDGSLAPLGGSVTITITATVNAGTHGTTISNQGSVSYDADGNGSNESTAMTDDPAVGGATDPTAFVVQSASVSGSMTVSGSFSLGGTVTYTVSLSNSGTAAQADNAGNEFTDVLPAGLTLVSANATAGTATAAVGTNTVTWDGSIPAGGSVTITITAAINSATTISNQGTIAYDADLNGTNEASAVTDDPGVGGATDPTTFVVQSNNVSGNMTVSGTYTIGSMVAYTVTLSNSGTATQADNAGNEFSDVLPAGLTLVSANASSGTAVTAGNTATWNGSLASLGGSVTITINATVNAGTQGTTISNQGTVSYDADGNGSNESTAMTDDPAVGGATDPTAFVVQSASVSGSMTVGGSFSTGNTVTYTVVLSNSGSAATLDNAGNEFTDLLPAALALVSANASAGTAVANTGTGTVSWNGSIPAGGSVTMTITATVNSGAASGTVVSNQGTVSVDTDLNGTNETAVSTDDPAVGGANDPTVFTVNGVAVSATKVVSGSFVRGGTVSYTIVLSNAGNAATADNPGNEFTDVLPASLILVSATASSGTAVASVGTNTVTWNGSIPASGSVTIMITATIDSSIPAGNTVQVINQGSFAYDADLNGTNESTGVTNDPAAVGGTPGSNATGFQLAAAVVPLPAAIPTVSELALLLMGLGLLAMAWMRERRGSRV